MTVSVLIPFSPDSTWRVQALEHAVRQYTESWETIIGTVDGPWRKAAAVADAARTAAGEIFVVADADCVCGGVEQAVAAVSAGAGWAMPHGNVHRLDEEATLEVYAGTPPEQTVGRAERTRRGMFGGGIVVVTRQAWERAPLDPRFVGWGQEDSSWGLALDTLCGPPARLNHDLWHLWHPPAPRRDRRIGSDQGHALFERYRQARNRPDVMAKLIEEARNA